MQLQDTELTCFLKYIKRLICWVGTMSTVTADLECCQMIYNLGYIFEIPFNSDIYTFTFRHPKFVMA